MLEPLAVSGDTAGAASVTAEVVATKLNGAAATIEDTAGAAYVTADAVATVEIVGDGVATKDTVGAACVTAGVAADGKMSEATTEDTACTSAT